jgi:hypothetical protein
LTRKGFLRATTHEEPTLEGSASLFPSGGAHEKEVSLMRRAVRFERIRQASKILLKMR